MKPLLVGEANPYQTNAEDADRFAFYPEPRYASGWRLCVVIMGLDERTYLRSFDRTDLCHPKWSLPTARRRALELAAARTHDDVIVCCGAKVAAAFGVAHVPYSVTRYHNVATVAKPQLVILPHPSGLNRAWHQPNAIAMARTLLRDVGVLPEVAA